VKEAPKKFHFLGICGTAMASVAAALKERGFKVTGSDENAYPPMSTFLQEKGVSLKEGYRPENIPADADVVVIGNAMKRGNPEVEAVLNRKLLYLSLPEVLKNYFLRGRHNLVVTGTHGKTTTTALLTWIMEKAGRKPGYVIGGLPKNLGQGARLNDSKYFVIEGDEYDSAFFDKRSKFIHYLPELLIINNIEFDHADIFNDLDEIKLSFRRLLNIVPRNGMVLVNGDDANCVEVAKDCLAQMIEVGFSKNCAQRIRDDDVGNSVRVDVADIGRRGQNRLDPIGETGIADQQFNGNDAGLLQADALSAIVSVADAGLPARISESSAGRPTESGPSFPKTPRTLPIGCLSQAVMTSPCRTPAR